MSSFSNPAPAYGDHLNKRDLTKHLLEFMSKKASSLKNSVHPGFGWARDSGFTPPQKGEGPATHIALVPAASRAGDLKPLVEEFLETLVGTVKATAGVVRIRHPHAQTLQIISSVGLLPGLLEAESVANLNCELLDKTASEGCIYSSDTSECEIRPICRNVGCQFKSIVTASLENRSSLGNSNGILTLFFDTPQEESDRVSQTVLAFAHLLSTIIEHNKSIREDKRVNLIAERQSIANEIHDSLAQTLVYTRMRTSLLIESIRTCNEFMAAKYARDIDEALECSQKTVRELITDFRCAMDPAGLLHALQNLTEQFCHRNDIALEYINRVAHLELPLEYEIQAYHIVHEALANIATHSGATHARLIMDFAHNYYVITIEDNGSGGCTFTPVEGHYGMMIMRERAQRIGGKISVESSNGFGTRVQLSFPEPGSDWRMANE